VTTNWVYYNPHLFNCDLSNIKDIKGHIDFAISTKQQTNGGASTNQSLMLISYRYSLLQSVTSTPVHAEITTLH